MNILKITKDFIEEMNKTNSVLDKKEVLKKYPEMREMIEAVYNPFKQYYVSSDNLKKNSHIVSNIVIEDIYEVLNLLQTRKITGHTALGQVNNFIKYNSQYEDIIYKIIDKDLECRVGDKIINDIYPGLVPSFEVALANNYKDFVDKVDLVKDNYYASHKLDGCRCIAVMDKFGAIKFYSRQGKEFEVLENLKKEIETMNLKDVVLDGEICILDKEGKENFQDIMKEIRRKDHQIANPKYLVFDQIRYTDFFDHKSKEVFLDRQENLARSLGKYKGNNIEQLKQTKIESMEQFAELCKESETKGWEGLILRKDTSYKGKRSSDILKMKKMDDAEYKVIDIETGPFRVIEDEIEKTIETLSAIKIEHKGNIVSVGSGFSINQRKEFYKDPSKIIGKTITVQYFEETKNKEGKYSLRFPVIKFIY